MSLPLFDPLGRGGRDPDRLLTVSELTARIRDVLETDFDEVGVEGEISNLAQPRSGHVYFTLKDAGAQIRAVLWKTAAQKLVFALEDGLSVRVMGGLSVYAPRGEYQIVARRIEPAGLGALDLAFRQLVARLEAEGLFQPARKRPIPRYPTRIAIVSSPTGAAVRDIVRVMGQRWPLAELLIIPSRVQGAGASEELIAALGQAHAVPGVDFVVLTRGGGSLEDLWAFNDEALARAIVASRLPVVSAVGHEIDTTIADLAADLRAPTPSAAGALCTPDCTEVRLRLDDLEQRLGRLLHLRTQRAAAGLKSLEQRATHALQRLWIGLRARLGTLSQRLDHATQRDLDRRQHRLAQLAARLEAMSPLAVLARGYSITQDEATGRVLHTADTGAVTARIDEKGLRVETFVHGR